jgi:long-subunit fatty acid transport protein
MLICLVVLFQLIVSPAWGLTNEENFAQFQFNFNTPGARAVGLGGAFISIADDATASEANPAGLVILERPEVSAEIKIINTKTDVPFSSTGLFDPDITVIQKEFDETAASPSFFSFTYPLERIAFAIYRQEILRFKQEFETQGAIVPGSTHIDSTTGVLTSNRLRPVQSETEIDIVNFGISLAYKITNTFSTGISLRFSRMDIDSNLSRFDVGPFLESPASFSEQNRRFTPIVNDSETGNSVNIGLLWRPDSKLSFGAVYRKGPEFTSLWMLTPGPVLPDVSTRFEDFTLKVPDSYGFGISYRPTNALTIGFDLVRIEYSDLLKNFQTPLEGAFGVTFPDDYELDDGTEVHLGAEYVFVVQSIPLAIRGGIFRDPDHRIRFNGPDPDIRLLFPEGDDEIHITFGGGIVPKDNFQIDVAGNISENIKEFIISSVYRF